MNVTATTAKARETHPMASFVIRGAGLTRRIRASYKTESAVEGVVCASDAVMTPESVDRERPKLHPVDRVLRLLPVRSHFLKER
jgi:hypothetical protein